MAVARPERTCVACRKKGARGELLRLVASPDGVVIDYSEKLPGRGAYVCPDPDCIGRSLKGNAVQKTLRSNFKWPEEAAFIGSLTEKIRRKADSLLGIARKSGKLKSGFDAAVEEARRHPGGVFLAAVDLSENTLHKINESGLPGEVYRYSTKDGLGGLLGLAPVGVLYVADPLLADALKKELGRLILFSRG